MMNSSGGKTELSDGLGGIEVVELEEVDLDFAVEEAMRPARKTVESIAVEQAKPEDFATVELFKGIGPKELAAVAARCQLVNVVPGYVLVGSGRLNTKVFFVIDGQLRLYRDLKEKRPAGIVDVGQTIGLHAALTQQPLNYSIIATEESQLLSVDLAIIDDLAQRSHPFAGNYIAMLAVHLREENYLRVGANIASFKERPGYVDGLTLLHNHRWLEAIYPRIIMRCKLSDSALSVVMFAVDRFADISKEHGMATGDRILATIGEIMIESARPTDLLVIDSNRRFIVLLPGGDLDAARGLAQRLKDGVKAKAITSVMNKPLPPVTISLGVTQLKKGVRDSELLKIAEALVQKSSNMGGDWLSE